MIDQSTALLISLAALQVADALSTIKVIELGGRELNPIVRWLIEVFGMVPALVIKGVVVMLAAWHLTTTMLLVMILFYFAVIAWNSWVAHKLEGK